MDRSLCAATEPTARLPMPLPTRALLLRLGWASERAALAQYFSPGLRRLLESTACEQSPAGKTTTSEQYEVGNAPARLHGAAEEEQVVKDRSWSSDTASPTTCSNSSSSPLSCTPCQRDGEVDGATLLGRVWELARESEGCREVQRALERDDDEVQAAIASELRGHILQAIECPHANHVVQKCIVRLPPEDLQFILDELLGGGPEAVESVVRHKYGCRVVKRLLERATGTQVRPIFEALMENMVDTARHPFGTFVVQHMMLYLEEGLRRRLILRLIAGAVELAADSHGCAALGAALADSGLPDEALCLARRLAQETGLLVEMACLRHGCLAVKGVLRALEGRERKLAQQQLAAGADKLNSSRYGRAVARQHLTQAPKPVSLEVVLQTLRCRGA